MDACALGAIRDDYVRQALTRAAAGDAAGAQEAIDRAARVWPVDDEQTATVRTALAGRGTLLDPNRMEG